MLISCRTFVGAVYLPLSRVLLIGDISLLATASLSGLSVSCTGAKDHWLSSSLSLSAQPFASTDTRCCLYCQFSKHFTASIWPIYRGKAIFPHHQISQNRPNFLTPFVNALRNAIVHHLFVKSWLDTHILSSLVKCEPFIIVNGEHFISTWIIPVDLAPGVTLV